MQQAQSSATPQRSVWMAAAVFLIATALFSIPLFWIQQHFRIATWVFNLGSIAPVLGGLVALALRRPLRLPLLWLPGGGFDVQVVRRTIVGIGAALAILLLVVQFYGFFRWGLRPTELSELPHPLAMPDDTGTIFGFVALGLLVGVTLEEFGWRTILEPTLNQKLGVLATGIAVGVCWGLWQWPVWQSLIDRQESNPSRMQALLYAGSHMVVAVAVSLILVIIHQRMRRGRWASSVAFRVVFGLGFFLILDEESGRWQPMFAIAACSAGVAAVGYFYHWRGERVRRANAERRRQAASGVPSKKPKKSTAAAAKK
ncbi:hypothetical protein HJ590_05425 [Naumannella sp. ID2617S]|nr:hypothetical protein [Naumannella sp. ID2617S]